MHQQIQKLLVHAVNIFSCPENVFFTSAAHTHIFKCTSGVRSAMRAASQLPGKGPTDVDDAPALAC